MFNHCKIDLPEVTTKTIDKKRYYVTPKGYYPSITTVLSSRNKKGLFEWRKRVGEAKAQQITQESANTVSYTHLTLPTNREV